MHIRSKRTRLCVGLVAAGLWFTTWVSAQNSPATQTQAQTPPAPASTTDEGKEFGGFRVTQSVEIQAVAPILQTP